MMTHDFGMCRPGDYYNRHIWDQLFKTYSFAVNDCVCDNDTIKAEAERRLGVIKLCKEGVLPRSAYNLSALVGQSEDIYNSVVTSMNTHITNDLAAGKTVQFDMPIRLNMRNQGGPIIKVAIHSSFFREYQQWIMANIHHFSKRNE